MNDSILVKGPWTIRSPNNNQLMLTYMYNGKVTEIFVQVNADANAVHLRDLLEAYAALRRSS